MSAYYDKQILDCVAAAARPLRQGEIAARIAPGNNRAWGKIGTALMHLYRSGQLSREKTDGRYWHYTRADTSPLIDRLAALLTAARAYRDAWLGDMPMGPLAIGERWEALRAAIEALEEKR